MPSSSPTKYSWQAPEFETPSLSRNFLLSATVFLLCIVAYALISGSPVMAITFILIGMVGYMQLEKEPRILTFAIIPDGVVVEKELYPFENILSFSLNENEEWPQIQLETTGQLVHSLTIPLGNTDPQVVRELLSGFIPETKHEPSMVDIIGKVLHI